MMIQVCPNCGAKNRVDEQAALRTQPVCGRCGAKLAQPVAAEGKPQAVSDASFTDEVLNASASSPVLVDAWAEWCGPCRMIAPIIDQLATESGGRYKVTKLNVDENPRTAAQFQIRSIPTLLIFKNGRLVDQIIGAQSKKAIAARLQAQF